MDNNQGLNRAKGVGGIWRYSFILTALASWIGFVGQLAFSPPFSFFSFSFLFYGLLFTLSCALFFYLTLQAEKYFQLRFFFSAPLIVSLLVALIFWVVMGTLILQNQSAARYTQLYGELATILLRFHIYDIFHHGAFISLLAWFVLCIMIYLSQLPLTLQTAGLWLLHAGVVIVCVGGFVSFLTSTRGNLNLQVGESRSVFLDYQAIDSRVTPKPLPFQVRLDHFLREDYPLRWNLILHTRQSGNYQIYDAAKKNRILVNGVMVTTEPAQFHRMVLFVPEKSPKLQDVCVQFAGRKGKREDEFFWLDNSGREPFSRSSILGGGASLCLQGVKLCQGQNQRPAYQFDAQQNRFLPMGGPPAVAELRHALFLIRANEIRQKCRLVASAKRMPGEEKSILPVVQGSFSHQNNFLLTYRDNLHVKELPGGVRLTLQPAKVEAKNFQSLLTILENGNPVKQMKIRVNQPGWYKGYRIYQAHYREDNANFAGLLLVRDQGVWISYTGFFFLFIGLLWHFLRQENGERVYAQ